MNAFFSESEPDGYNIFKKTLKAYVQLHIPVYGISYIRINTCNTLVDERGGGGG